MAGQEQIANFIRRRVSLGRIQPGRRYWIEPVWRQRHESIALPYFGPPLPTVKQIAGELVQDAEYRALELGGILSTPSGEFLEQAIQLAIPRLLLPEFELLIAAFKFAAILQQRQSRTNAIMAVGGSELLGLILNNTGRRGA